MATEFADVVNAIDDPLAIIFIRELPSGRYVYVNDNYGVMLPFTREQVLGKTNRELYGAEVAQSWELTDMLTTASQTFTVTPENLFDKKTKKWRKFVSTKTLISDDAGQQFLAGISVEVKDKLAAEYETRLAFMRARFLELLQHRND